MIATPHLQTKDNVTAEDWEDVDEYLRLLGPFVEAKSFIPISTPSCAALPLRAGGFQEASFQTVLGLGRFTKVQKLQT